MGSKILLTLLILLLACESSTLESVDSVESNDANENNPQVSINDFQVFNHFRYTGADEYFSTQFGHEWTIQFENEGMMLIKYTSWEAMFDQIILRLYKREVDNQYYDFGQLSFSDIDVTGSMFRYGFEDDLDFTEAGATTNNLIIEYHDSQVFKDQTIDTEINISQLDDQALRFSNIAEIESSINNDADFEIKLNKNINPNTSYISVSFDYVLGKNVTLNDGFSLTSSSISLLYFPDKRGDHIKVSNSLFQEMKQHVRDELNHFFVPLGLEVDNFRINNVSFYGTEFTKTGLNIVSQKRQDDALVKTEIVILNEVYSDKISL